MPFASRRKLFLCFALGAQGVFMKNRRLFGAICFFTRLGVAAAAFVAFPIPSLAQLNVLISGGFSSAYREVLPEFERTTGIKVTTGSGASQGTGQQTIAAQLHQISRGNGASDLLSRTSRSKAS